MAWAQAEAPFTTPARIAGTRKARPGSLYQPTRFVRRTGHPAHLVFRTARSQSSPCSTLGGRPNKSKGSDSIDSTEN